MIANIGGIFIYSENPKDLADWYKEFLGIDYEYTKEYEAYYASLYYTDANENKKRYTAFSIMNSKKRPIMEERLFTLNLRVYDMEKVVAHLREKGLEVKGIEIHDEGKFAWARDPENNHIELWQDTMEHA